MKRIILLIVILLTAVIVGVLVYFFSFQPRFQVMDGDGMVRETPTDRLESLYWSRSASTMDGCFTFAVTCEDGFRLSGSCFSEKKSRIVDFENRKMSADGVARLCLLLDEALTDGLLTVYGEPDGEEEELIALDAPSSVFRLTFSDERGEAEYVSSDSALWDSLYELLSGEAKV